MGIPQGRLPTSFRRHFLSLSHPLTGQAHLSASSFSNRPLPPSLPVLETVSPPLPRSPTPLPARLGFKWRASARPSTPPPHFPPLLASAPACCAQRPSPERHRDPPREIRRTELSLPASGCGEHCHLPRFLPVLLSFLFVVSSAVIVCSGGSAMVPPRAVVRGPFPGRARSQVGLAFALSLSRSFWFAKWCTVAPGRSTPATSHRRQWRRRRSPPPLRRPCLPLPLSHHLLLIPVVEF